MDEVWRRVFDVGWNATNETLADDGQSSRVAVEVVALAFPRFLNFVRRNAVDVEIPKCDPRAYTVALFSDDLENSVIIEIEELVVIDFPRSESGNLLA